MAENTSNEFSPLRDLEDVKVLMLKEIFESGKLCNIVYGGGSGLSNVRLVGYDAAYCKWQPLDKGPIYVARGLCNIIEILDGPYVVTWISTPVELRRIADILEGGVQHVIESEVGDGVCLRVVPSEVRRV